MRSPRQHAKREKEGPGSRGGGSEKKGRVQVERGSSFRSGTGWCADMDLTATWEGEKEEEGEEGNGAQEQAGGPGTRQEPRSFNLTRDGPMYTGSRSTLMKNPKRNSNVQDHREMACAANMHRAKVTDGGASDG